MKAKKYWILIVALWILAISFASVETQDTDKKRVRQEVKELLQEAEKQLALLEVEDDVRSLVGLKGVHVVVDLNPNQKTHGLTKEKIQKDIELWLRQHNINVISDGAFLTYLYSIKETDPNRWQSLSQTVPTWALLCIEVDHISLDDMLPVCTYHIGIRIRQPIILVRDERIFCTGITWSTDSVGYAGITIFADAVHESLKDYVDKFINDYLSANPRPKNEEQK